MQIRQANETDFEEIWLIFHEIVSAGDTWAFFQDIPKGEAIRQWFHLLRKTFVVEEERLDALIIYKWLKTY